MIQLTDDQLEQYARELFRTANTAFAEMEDNVVEGFVLKVSEKHKVPFSIGGHSLVGNQFAVKMPQTVNYGNQGFQGILNAIGSQGRPQQQQRDLFGPAFFEQANEAETRL